MIIKKNNVKQYSEEQIKRYMDQVRKELEWDNNSHNNIYDTRPLGNVGLECSDCVWYMESSGVVKRHEKCETSEYRLCCNFKLINQSKSNNTDFQLF